MTDFWNEAYSPATQSKLKDGQTINEYCYEKELQQGKNIVDAAAEVEGLQRLVLSALCDATKISGGKYKWVYHYDSKARFVEYLKENYPELDEKLDVIQVGSYMSNSKAGLLWSKVSDPLSCLE